MESSGIQRLFYVLWMIIKLNLYFILFSLMGGILLGVGPAFQTMNDLLAEHGLNYQEITFKKFLAGWKMNFKRGNQHFLLFFGIISLLSYNLYLSVQIQGLVWLVIDFALFFTILLVSVLFIYVTLYQTSYDISLLNVVKLAFVSVFLNFGTFLKILFGVVSILFITWLFKGLVLFATFALLIIWSGYATKESRTLVERKLAAHG
ncbi:YesL family protein [Enterococcus sp. LJL120]